MEEHALYLWRHYSRITPATFLF